MTSPAPQSPTSQGLPSSATFILPDRLLFLVAFLQRLAVYTVALAGTQRTWSIELVTFDHPSPSANGLQSPPRYPRPDRLGSAKEDTRGGRGGSDPASSTTSSATPRGWWKSVEDHFSRPDGVAGRKKPSPEGRVHKWEAWQDTEDDYYSETGGAVSLRNRNRNTRRRRWGTQTRDDDDIMKFSHSIQFNAVPDWSNYYIAYSNLKKL